MTTVRLSRLREIAADFIAGNRKTPLLAAMDIGRRVRIRMRGIPVEDPPLLPEEGLDYWVSVFRERARDDYDVVVLVTGETGVGKTTCALRMLEAVDQTFRATTLPQRLCYSTDDVLAAYEIIQPGQGILFDEGVLGLLSTDTFSKEQKALIKALALIRAKRAILYICAPSINNIAKAIRTDRSYAWIWAPRRGLGKVHIRVNKPHYKADERDLGLYESSRAPYLLWAAYPSTSVLWGAYSSAKMIKMAAILHELREELARGRSARRPKETRAIEAQIVRAEHERGPAGVPPTVNRPMKRFSMSNVRAIEP